MAAMKEPTPTSPMKVPTESFTRKEPTRSSPRKEPIQSSPQKALSQSRFRRESPRTPLRNELTKSPSIEKKIQKSPRKDSTESPSIREKIQKSPRKEPTDSPSRLGPSNSAHSDAMQASTGKDIVSPKSSLKTLGNDVFHQELHILQSPLFTQKMETSSERKRSIGDTLDDVRHIDKIPRVERNQDIHRSGNFGSEFMLYHSNEIYDEREKIEGDTTLMHWSDVSILFSHLLLLQR